MKILLFFLTIILFFYCSKNQNHYELEVNNKPTIDKKYYNVNFDIIGDKSPNVRKSFYAEYDISDFKIHFIRKYTGRITHQKYLNNYTEIEFGKGDHKRRKYFPGCR